MPCNNLNYIAAGFVFSILQSVHVGTGLEEEQRCIEYVKGMFALILWLGGPTLGLIH